MGQGTLDDHISFDDEAPLRYHGGKGDIPIVKASPVKYTFDGVKVRFPFEAYGCQIEMMENIIRTLNSKQGNALLESPTGSGKSLALLCGVLGWLEHQKTQLIKESSEESKQGEKIGLKKDSSHPEEGDSVDMEHLQKDASNVKSQTSKINPEQATKVYTSLEDKDFVSPPMKKVKMAAAPQNFKASSGLPTIYIASRTHRQIAQLVKELGRTDYQPKFVVLGSRTHYCINERVRKMRDINEGCREVAFAAGGGTCSFYNGLGKMARVRGPNYTPDCDIEDLVQQSKRERTCAYFLSRAALDHAEIVFTPYNYLVDPMIRKAMGIKLDQDIVIVDEAHNIEDVCREAGSFEVTDNTLAAIQGELLSITKTLRERPKSAALLAAHECQGHVISILANWMKHASSTRGSVRRDFETVTTIWQNQTIVEELHSIGIVYEQVTAWMRELQVIQDRANDPPPVKDESQEEHLLSFGSTQVLQGLYHSLINMLQNKNHFLASYRMVKYQTSLTDSAGKRIVITLGFWCLNPEVIFRALQSACKSVILTSGTLSPMDTFSSELNAQFEQRLEALHIISESQTWVGCIPAGPEGNSFLGNFKTMDAFAYQDDLGRAILRVAKTVPAGMLVFLPSYSFLDKVVRRMQAIGIYSEIAKCKRIFLEPRQGTPQDFERLLQKYYEAVKEGPFISQLSNSTKPTGALLFAIYRGKISEGLDLRDDNCRAVISVGIPYPAFKDPRVVLKREFNDRPGSGRRLLTGQQWYEIQAFRALNQALGRCIRHRHDWGAVILLEQRFTNPRNITQLSKWVRGRVQIHSKFDEAMNSLADFIQKNSKNRIDIDDYYDGNDNRVSSIDFRQSNGTTSLVDNNSLSGDEKGNQGFNIIE